MNPECYPQSYHKPDRPERRGTRSIKDIYTLDKRDLARKLGIDLPLGATILVGASGNRVTVTVESIEDIH